MRILIVGAGVGGMTLAALLQRRGVPCSLVEKAASVDHGGYMLGLYPIGSRVLHGLGLYDAFADNSEPMASYQMGNGDGDVVHRYEMDFLDDRYGPILQCTRPELLRVLERGVEPSSIRFATALQSIEESGDEVTVTLSDGSQESYDLVVGADGIHSTVRDYVAGEQPYRDTGWGGWVWWAPVGTVEPDTVTEYWGPGTFLGVYPTKNAVGVFAGGPTDEEPAEADGRQARLRAGFAALGERQPALFDALPGDDAEMFYWGFKDVRSPTWTKGRTVLLGDAAAAFLPTAGIGASMAMESAAVLNDELSRTSRRYLPAALDFYVRRRRERVEAVQDDSRGLARMMFVESTPVSAVRNFLMRFYSLRMLAKDIVKAFEQPI